MIDSDFEAELAAFIKFKIREKRYFELLGLYKQARMSYEACPNRLSSDGVALLEKADSLYTKELVTLRRWYSSLTLKNE